MSKLNIQDKFLLAADGTLELNGNAVVDFNTSGRLMLGNQDWLSLGSHSTAHAEPDQEGTLSSVNHNYDLGGMHATGQAVNIIKTRIPVDGLSTYNVKVRVKKLKDADNAITTNSGAQITNRDTFYCGVISSDGNFNHIHADLASSYQYGAANGEGVRSTGGHGNTDGVYTFEGSFSGFNATDEGDHNKFDPGTQYFDIVIICNYIGYYTNSAASFVENVKGQTVIESLEVQRGSTGSVGFEAEAGQFSYTGNQFNYYADPTVDLVSTGLSGSVEFINRGKTIDGEFKEGKGFQFWTNGGAGASEITFDAAGNVGIGTDTPGAKLEVGGTVMINNTLSNPGLWFGQGTANVRGYIGGGDYAVNGGADGDFGISGATDGSLLFGTTTSTGGTDHERMRITSLGKVGIGTSDPILDLDVYGKGKDIGVTSIHADGTRIYHSILGTDGDGNGVFGLYNSVGNKQVNISSKTSEISYIKGRLETSYLRPLPPASTGLHYGSGTFELGDLPFSHSSSFSVGELIPGTNAPSARFSSTYKFPGRLNASNQQQLNGDNIDFSIVGGDTGGDFTGMSITTGWGNLYLGARNIQWGGYDEYNNTNTKHNDKQYGLIVGMNQHIGIGDYGFNTGTYLSLHEVLSVHGAIKFTDTTQTAPLAGSGSDARGTLWYNDSSGTGAFYYRTNDGQDKVLGTGDVSYTYNYTGTLLEGAIDTVNKKIGTDKVLIIAGDPFSEKPLTGYSNNPHFYHTGSTGFDHYGIAIGSNQVGGWGESSIQMASRTSGGWANIYINRTGISGATDNRYIQFAHDGVNSHFIKGAGINGKDFGLTSFNQVIIAGEQGVVITDNSSTTQSAYAPVDIFVKPGSLNSALNIQSSEQYVDSSNEISILMSLPTSDSGNAVLGKISTQKENTTSGDYKGQITLETRSGNAGDLFSEGLKIESSGKVLFPLQDATTSGAMARVHIQDEQLEGSSTAASGQLCLENAGLSGGKWGISTTASGWNIGGGGKLGFFADMNASNSYLTLTQEGKVGVGLETNPLTPLHVKGINDTTFVNYVATTTIEGTNSFNSADSGAGITFMGKYTAENSTTFGNISVLKENLNDGEYGSFMSFGTRQDNVGSNSSMERMRITSGGRVGIGTTEPTSMLDIQTDSTDALPIKVQSMHPNQTGLRLTNGTGNTASSWTMMGKSHGDLISPSSLAFMHGTSAPSAENQILVLTPNGDVGIGTSVPTKTLDVNGDINFSGSIYQNGQLFESGGGGGASISTVIRGLTPADGFNGSDTAMFALESEETQPGSTERSRLNFGVLPYGGTNGAEEGNGYIQARTADLLLQPGTGNVGIGTDTPEAKLEVGGTVMINNTLSNPGLWFGQGTANVRGYIGGGDYAVNGGADGDFGISGATDGSLLFGTTTSTGGTDHERMRITSLGKVGIGTSDPFATLDIRGTFAISNSTTSYWDFDRDDSDGSLKIADTGTERVRIDSGGNVGIGATNPSERLHVSGAAQFDSRNTSEQGQAGSIWYNTNVGDGVFQYVDKLGSTKAIGTGDITYNYTGNLWSGDPDQNNNINFITGKVGIGKVSPVHNLDSYTNEDSSYALYGKSDHINGGGILAWTPNLSSNKFVAYLEGSSNGAGLYVKGDGKVGVGSMYPSASLEILGKQSDDSIQLIETLSTGPGSLSLNRTYECLQEITGSSSVQKHSIIITANASSTFAFKIEIVKEATSTTAAGVISAGGHTASSKINKSQIGNSDWESTLSSAAQYYSLSPDDLEGIQADGKLTIPFYNKTGSTSKDTYYIKVEVLGSQSGDVTAVEFSPDVSFDFTNAFNFEIEV